MKSALIIISNTPFGDCQSQEAIDIALAFSNFEKQVGLLFVDDGVWHLQKNLDAEKIFQKNYTDVYASLELYDINNIYAESNALQIRNIISDNLNIKPKILNYKEINTLIASYDALLNF